MKTKQSGTGILPVDVNLGRDAQATRSLLKTAALVLFGLFLLSTPLRAVPPLPDFAVESVTLDPPVPVEDMFMTVTTTITNRGDVGGDARFLDIWFNRSATNPPVRGDVGDWWGKVGRLEAGESVSITSPPIYQPASGSFHLCAYVEFESIVSETTKTNNHFCLDYEAASVSSMLRPVYRFGSSSGKGHLYTISEHEKRVIVENYSNQWLYEGMAYEAFTLKVKETVPVYRFYSNKNGSYHFTASKSEHDAMIKAPSTWRYEGVSHYIYSALGPGTLPVYGFSAKPTGSNFFTTSRGERDALVANHSDQWRYEGESFYTLATSQTGGMEGRGYGGMSAENSTSSSSLTTFSLIDTSTSSGSEGVHHGSGIEQKSSVNISVPNRHIHTVVTESISFAEDNTFVNLTLAPKDDRGEISAFLYDPVTGEGDLIATSPSSGTSEIQPERGAVEGTFISIPLSLDEPSWLEVYVSAPGEPVECYGALVGLYSDASQLPLAKPKTNPAIMPRMIVPAVEIKPNGDAVTAALYSADGEELRQAELITEEGAIYIDLAGLRGTYLLTISDGVGFTQLSWLNIIWE